MIRSRSQVLFLLSFLAYVPFATSGDYADLLDELTDKECQRKIRTLLKIDDSAPHEMRRGKDENIYNVEWVSKGTVRSIRMKCFSNGAKVEVGIYRSSDY